MADTDLQIAMARLEGKVDGLIASLNERCEARGIEIRDIKTVQAANSLRITALEADANKAKGAGQFAQWTITAAISAVVAIVTAYFKAGK